MLLIAHDPVRTGRVNFYPEDGIVKYRRAEMFYIGDYMPVVKKCEEKKPVIKEITEKGGDEK